MDLDNTQRLQLLAKTLLRKPLDIPRYLGALPVWGRWPLDLELPWWSFGAIDALKKACTGSQDAFEFGTGGSTLFLAQRCKSVTSVEQDPEWHGRLLQTLAARGTKNVEVLLRPFDLDQMEGFDESTYLHSLDRDYDIIVVDGYDRPRQARKVCFHRAESFIRPGGVIVVDDSWMYPDLRVRNRAQRWQTFESCGPCRVGVTSTDLFFY